MSKRTSAPRAHPGELLRLFAAALAPYLRAELEPRQDSVALYYSQHDSPLGRRIGNGDPPQAIAGGRRAVQSPQESLGGEHLRPYAPVEAVELLPGGFAPARFDQTLHGRCGIAR